ncbi:MAG: hypothetical protein ACI934_002118 [Pseudohongiellaceae bacterium]
MSVDSGEKSKFKVMLNPETYNHKSSISYSKEKSLGQVGGESNSVVLIQIKLILISGLMVPEL